MNFPGRWKPRNSFKPDSRIKLEIMIFALMHSESNYFPTIETTCTCTDTIHCSSEPQMLGSAKHRRYIFSKVVHSPRRKVQARVAAMSLTWNRRKEETLLKGRLHTHTYIHMFQEEYRFPTSEFSHKFSGNETEKLSARKEFNRISLNCSFFHCREPSPLPPHPLLKPEKFTGLLIAAKTRRDNCRHLNSVVPNCIA